MNRLQHHPSLFPACNLALALLAFGPAATWGQQIAADAAAIAVVRSPQATPPEQVAADELARYLGRLYPKRTFQVATAEPPDANFVLRIGTPQSTPELPAMLGEDKLAGSESFVVARRSLDGKQIGLILGADGPGVLYGTYALLQRLGCGFYLSFETLPENSYVNNLGTVPIFPQGKWDCPLPNPESSFCTSSKPNTRPFSLEAWDLADRPLTPTRLVFNWHNFLTGCSVWDLEDWQKWSTQSQKMGFNTIMVHAYGNNPMSGFRFRGRDKPVGWLSSSDLGRNWYVNHVNDVRRMYGDSAFTEPALGSTAAVDGTYRQRTAAARKLMRAAFAHAQRRGIKVVFAFDVDTWPGNPQELVTLLDRSERFEVQGRWLPNPDRPGGYAFYQAEVTGLMRAYPQIDTLAVWHRTGGTPWMSYRREDMPPAWQAEFDAVCREHPEVEKDGHAIHHFGMAKIVRACQRALRELGRQDVTVAYGSWRFDFLAPADRFLPKDVPLIPLDYMVLVDRSQLADAERRAVIARIADHRPVWPIVWAQHDDGAHVMRPFTPYEAFYDKLADAKAARHGFGILHWMTRPLDLYFTSLSRQAWQGTRNEPLAATCRHVADRWFGPSQGDVLAEYLQRWVTEAPMFARDTSDWFVDRPLPDPEPLARSMLDRFRLLARARGLSQFSRSNRGLSQFSRRENGTVPLRTPETPPVRARSPTARQRITYFRGIEQFSLDVHRMESDFRKAHALIAQGKTDEARAVVTSIGDRPQRIVDDLAETIQIDDLNPGELGLIVTLNTRWLTHYVRLRQRLGLEAVRYNFGPTRHDPLTERWGGRFTFYYTRDRAIWQTLGEKETGAKTYQIGSEPALDTAGLSPAEDGLVRQGIVVEQPLTLTLSPIMSQPHGRGDVKPTKTLPAGPYRLSLWTTTPADGKAHPFRVVVAAGGKTLVERTVPTQAAGSAAAAVLRSSCTLTFDRPSEVTLTIDPIEGPVRLGCLEIMLENASQ